MIEFKTVRFKNFGSFGNYFTEIYLDKYSMVLVYMCIDNATPSLTIDPLGTIELAKDGSTPTVVTLQLLTLITP